MISRNDFLGLVLSPLKDGEHYCSWGNKKENDETRVRQQFAASIEELSAQADGLQAEGYNAFYGMAKYGPKDNGRYATNAISLKSFFLDLDCGPTKPYATLSEGLAALKNFCKATKLPKPTIVRSGHGAHVYWVLEEAMPRQEWKPYAERLKDLCEEHKFDIDRAVPADAARVLRVPETNHLKDPTNPIPVEILYIAPFLTTEVLRDVLEPTENILAVLDKADSKRPMDAVTLALMGSSQSRFKTIMVKSVEGTGCAQLLHIFDNQTTIDEPLWRAGLSIAHQCVDRDKAIHVLSSKHPDYNSAETERKANETKGPYTCETFKKLNPAVCEGCTHKITSPIQLGKEIVEATEEDSVVTDLEPATKEAKTYVIPKYPYPFFRGKTGGIYQRFQIRGDRVMQRAPLRWVRAINRAPFLIGQACVGSRKTRYHHSLTCK